MIDGRNGQHAAANCRRPGNCVGTGEGHQAGKGVIQGDRTDGQTCRRGNVVRRCAGKQRVISAGIDASRIPVQSGGVPNTAGRATPCVCCASGGLDESRERESEGFWIWVSWDRVSGFNGAAKGNPTWISTFIIHIHHTHFFRR